VIIRHKNQTLSNNYRKQIHCKKGHIFSKKNTYVTPSGQRQCRKCRDGRVAEIRSLNLAAGLTTNGLVRKKARKHKAEPLPGKYS